MSRPQLSHEMRTLLDAMQSETPQAALPGLDEGARVRYIGNGLWRVDGAPRCWLTVTIRALLRRRLLTRAAPKIYRIETATSVNC